MIEEDFVVELILNLDLGPGLLLGFTTSFLSTLGGLGSALTLVLISDLSFFSLYKFYC